MKNPKHAGTHRSKSNQTDIEFLFHSWFLTPGHRLSGGVYALQHIHIFHQTCLNSRSERKREGVQAMRAHVLQHAAFEGIGNIESWLKSRDAEVRYTRFFKNPSLPDLKNLDLIVAMGGPMSANDEEEMRWLRFEKQFIRDAIGRGISVLGVCLGAQLIANTLGARVYRNAVKEIGWWPVEAIPGPEGGFRFPSTCEVFHWHGETFDLPPGAVLLAKSAACRNQAFQFGQNVIGLQFHIEVTAQGIRELVENCSVDLVPGQYVQSSAELAAVPAEAYAGIHRLLDDVLSYITSSRPR